MKTILAICALILIGGGFYAWKAMQMPTKYGAFTGAPVTDVTALVERPKDYLGKTVTVEGKISEQCKAMGCFFFFHSPKGILRIELAEVAMTAPMREGHTARVEGQLVPYGDGYQLFASGVEFQ
jgi:hypothetical protein